MFTDSRWKYLAQFYEKSLTFNASTSSSQTFHNLRSWRSPLSPYDELDQLKSRDITWGSPTGQQHRLPVYLSSISRSLLRAASHCGSPVVWSISSQITSNMPGAERPLVHGFTPWLSRSWRAQRIQSLGPAQSPASVSLFFLTGQLKKKMQWKFRVI